MDRSTKYYRRVFLEGRTRPDGGRARGLDEVLGTSLFGEAGRSGATGVRSGLRLGQLSDLADGGDPDDEIVGAIAEGLGREDATPRAGAEAPDVDVSFPDPAALAGAIAGLRERSATMEDAAAMLGMPAACVERWIAKTAKLAAQARHSVKGPVRSSDQEVLFDVGARSIDAGALGLRAAEAIDGFDLAQLCATVCARARAEAAQCASDPDLARLLRLQELLATARSRAEALAGDRIPDEGIKVALAGISGDDEQLARYNYDRNDPGAAHNEGRQARWGAGLAATWAVIRAEEAVIAAARSDLAGAVEGRGRRIGVAEAIGLIGLWSPAGARRLWVRHRHGHGAGVADMDLRGVPDPPGHFAAWGVDTVMGLVRRRGWLTGDPDEATLRERACRPFTIGAEAPQGRVALAGAMSDWARSGDPAGLVALMDSVRAESARTRWGLLVKEPDEAVAAVTELSRLAWSYLTGVEAEVRASLGERLFWRFPRRIVTEATELSRPV